MMFQVRQESGEPIYRQLTRQIKHAISTGSLRSRDKLPTVRQLAAELVVNPNTVARAYRELGREGVLEGGPRRGTFVRKPLANIGAAERRRRMRPHVEDVVAEAAILGCSIKELREMVQDIASSRLDRRL